MKKILFLVMSLVLMASCQHDVIYKVDYNVILDKDNTYYAGEPVKFHFTGEVDNLLFYSGEVSHQYKYANRYEVPVEDVQEANLHLDIRGRYGFEANYEALEIWVSKDFAGIDGVDDGDGDRALVKAMVEGEMQGWTKLTQFKDVNKDQVFGYDIPMNDYLSNLCIAFHWKPKAADKVQRTYWINGTIEVNLKGTPEPSVLTLTDLGMKTLMMNEQVEAYKKNAGDGSIRFDNSNAGQLALQGISAGKLEYAIDGWVFTTPQPLNKVANDKGVVIKNLENYLHVYEYTWAEPGTYKVTFVGRNENYASASQMVKEYTITILPKPEEN